MDNLDINFVITQIQSLATERQNQADWFNAAVKVLQGTLTTKLQALDDTNTSIAALTKEKDDLAKQVQALTQPIISETPLTP